MPNSTPAKITETCGSHPEGREHECMRTQMRCVYCGVRLAPYPCHSCGKFLTTSRMREATDGEMPHMCTECVP